MSFHLVHGELAVTLVLLLAAAEATVRLLGLAPVMIPIELDTRWGSFVTTENPRLKYIPRAGSHDIIIMPMASATGTTPSRSRAAPNRTVGDSFAFGLCVKDRLDTFPNLIEAAPRVRGWPLEVKGSRTTSSTATLAPSKTGPLSSPEWAGVEVRRTRNAVAAAIR